MRAFISLLPNLDLLKNIPKGNIPSNETGAHTKSMSMNIWAISTLNQLFIRRS